MRAFRRHKLACVSLAMIALLGKVLAMLAHCSNRGDVSFY